MGNDDFWFIVGLVIFLILLSIAAASLVVGNIVNQLLEPVPGVAGPIGAAAALIVFVVLAGKGLSLLADVLSQ